MRKYLNILLLTSPLILTGTAIAVSAASQSNPDLKDGTTAALSPLEQLGQQLFHEPLLSRNGTQSCATCHDPEHAFTDPRDTAANGAVSLGDDGESLGSRNTPTLSYAYLSPDFHQDAKGRYKGGQFWDGRADDLQDQAGQPMLNPVEMGMPDKASVVSRLRDAEQYRTAFEAVFGKGALDDVDTAFDHTTEALAAYQSTPEFAPFDSKFDRYMRGEEKLTPQEEFGYTVFMSWNCRLCHQLRQQGVTEQETFTSYEYHNIGVPTNPGLQALKDMGPDQADQGLLDRPGVDDPAQAGRMKVPTLRNVAVTGPYMHNGVFKDLRTAVIFYNKYPSPRPIHQINPETGEDWGPPEVAENLSLHELESGLMVSDERVDALVAFLETLTDRRYEPLLQEQRRARQQQQETATRD